jgi:hypothetical protein
MALVAGFANSTSYRLSAASSEMFHAQGTNEAASIIRTSDS